MPTEELEEHLGGLSSVDAGGRVPVSRIKNVTSALSIYKNLHRADE